MIVESMGELERKAGVEVSPVAKAFGYLFALLLAVAVWVLILLAGLLGIVAYYFFLGLEKLVAAGAACMLKVETEAHDDVLLCFERMSHFSRKMLGVDGTDLDNELKGARPHEDG